MRNLATFKSLMTNFLAPDARDALRQTPCSIELVLPPRHLRVTLTDRGELHVSTPIFHTSDEPHQIRAFEIARFNAHHLFRGGYCLNVDPQDHSIRLEQVVSVESFTPASLQEFGLDLLRRAAFCARWYAGLVEAEVSTPEAV